MMGERTIEQPALFSEFSLEPRVPEGHLLRSIDRIVDVSGIREHLRPLRISRGYPKLVSAQGLDHCVYIRHHGDVLHRIIHGSRVPFGVHGRAGVLRHHHEVTFVGTSSGRVLN